MTQLGTKRDFQDLVTRFDAGMDNFSRHLDIQLENFELRITIRFAVMLIAFIGVAAALVRLT